MKVLLTNDCDHGVWVEAATDKSLSELKASIEDESHVRKSSGSSSTSFGDSPTAIVLRTGRRVCLEEIPSSSSEIQDGDEILLLNSVYPISTAGLGRPFKISCVADAQPSQEEVARVTAHIPAGERPASIPPELPMDSLHQRTHLSLLEFAGRLQSLQSLAEVSQENEEAELAGVESVSSRVDEACVRQLADMGFPRERAVKALRLNGHNQEAAAEWLLMHCFDPSVDQPLPETPPKPRPRTRRGRWRAQAFVPSQSVLHNLREMGFAEVDILGALKATSNNQEQACEFLLSGQSFVEPAPLDKSSPLYQELFSCGTVLTSLTKPSVLEALIQLQDSPESLSSFIHDKDCGLFLHAVTRIVQWHHSEHY